MKNARNGRRGRARLALRATWACGLLLLAGSGSALAFTVAITPGNKLLYLQVGTGLMTGGNFNAGGTPGNSSVINSVSVTVPASAVGSGVPQAMSTDSTVVASPWDGTAFCTAPASTGQVYMGGFYRGQNSSASSANLTVTTPATLSNGIGGTIPFTAIAWTSSGSRGSTSIPSETFKGSTQHLLTVARNSWFENCLAFRYLNNRVVPPGTFRGRAVYSLSAP